MIYWPCGVIAGSPALTSHDARRRALRGKQQEAGKEQERPRPDEALLWIAKEAMAAA
eukprot:COSAG01_NODE_49920_length_368_cov_0.576208_1_plen_56_part_01